MLDVFIGENILSAMTERPKRYMPFAEGPRSCIGKTLAQTTLPLTLAILLSRFSFKLAEQVHLDAPLLL